MDRDLTQALRARNVNVITALEADMIARDDRLHLEYATGQGRALYSFNRGDYFRLHTQYLSQGESHAGIILSRQQDYSVGEQMRRLLKLLASVSAENMRDRIEFLSAWR